MDISVLVQRQRDRFIFAVSIVMEGDRWAFRLWLAIGRTDNNRLQDAPHRQLPDLLDGAQDVPLAAIENRPREMVTWIDRIYNFLRMVLRVNFGQESVFILLLRRFLNPNGDV